MKRPRRPKPPAHLKPDTARWFREVVRDYELESHHLRLLTAAAECWDRLQEARVILDRDGLTISTGDGGLKGHPAIAVERDSRLAFARLVRELDLDADAPTEAPRPPPLRSNGG